jgi:hypothetical protein
VCLRPEVCPTCGSQVPIRQRKDQPGARSGVIGGRYAKSSLRVDNTLQSPVTRLEASLGLPAPTGEGFSSSSLRRTAPERTDRTSSAVGSRRRRWPAPLFQHCPSCQSCHRDERLRSGDRALGGLKKLRRALMPRVHWEGGEDAACVSGAVADSAQRSTAGHGWRCGARKPPEWRTVCPTALESHIKAWTQRHPAGLGYAPDKGSVEHHRTRGGRGEAGHPAGGGQAAGRHVWHCALASAGGGGTLLRLDSTLWPAGPRLHAVAGDPRWAAFLGLRCLLLHRLVPLPAENP